MCGRSSFYKKRESILQIIIQSGYRFESDHRLRLQGRMVDALADRTDEGRLRLRYASGSRQQGFDPRISEWGNPPTVMGRYRLRPGGTQGSETSQYLQERIFRE